MLSEPFHQLCAVRSCVHRTFLRGGALSGVRDDAVLLQPRTRVPVAVQAVSYSDIVSMERKGKGIGTGKAVAIGVATGVGALFGMMAIMVALIGD